MLEMSKAIVETGLGQREGWEELFLRFSGGSHFTRANLVTCFLHNDVYGFV